MIHPPRAAPWLGVALLLILPVGAAPTLALAQTVTQQAPNQGQVANPLDAAPPLTQTSPSRADRDFVAHAAPLVAAQKDERLQAALERAARAAGIVMPAPEPTPSPPDGTPAPPTRVAASAALVHLLEQECRHGHSLALRRFAQQELPPLRQTPGASKPQARDDCGGPSRLR